MTAEPSIERVIAAFRKYRLEAILIGNAAAAIQGAPVTTDDFDFFFLSTVKNLEKLEAIAADWGTDLIQPYEATSDLYRIRTDDLQIDMMAYIGQRLTFEGVCSRADEVRMKAGKLLVASLGDVIKSKRAAGRAKDRAVLSLLEQVLREKK